MRLLDLYFHAFRAFKKHTNEDLNSQKLRKAITYSNHKNDILTTIKYDCKIEVDWIENIEEGLKFVEKAIREEHQFIRTEGEVVPIEKVRKVSKASVEHLSRHSALITRVPKNNSANLIPDKLYVVEKLSDYLVYENRFLYLLLCYLRDFIQMRLNKIKDKTTTYQSEMSIDKDIEANQRHLQYTLDFKDLYKNDPYLIEQYNQIPMVKRAETIYATVISFFATPLMKEVAKAPLLKTPIVKTNVLRMNQNFKAALKLYDYITAYNEDGYELIEVQKTYQPFPPEMSDEIADTIELNSMIGYVVGNDIRGKLERNSELKEKEQLKAQNKKKLDEIKRLKRRINEMYEDPSEYMLLLEKRNIQLEKENLNLAQEKQINRDLSKQLVALKEDALGLEESVLDLKMALADKNTEMDKMNQKYFDDMTLAETIHQKELSETEEAHATLIKEWTEANKLYIEDLKKECLSQQKEIQDSFKIEREQLFKAHEKDVLSLISKYEIKEELSLEKQNYLRQEIDSYKVKEKQNKTTIGSLKKESKRLDEESKFSNARYIALKAQQGLITEDDDFTSKEKFQQLELEMKAYKKLFKEQWKLAKKNIREKAKKRTIKEEKIEEHK
jgi:hypothetical protein